MFRSSFYDLPRQKLFRLKVVIKISDKLKVHLRFHVKYPSLISYIYIHKWHVVFDWSLSTRVGGVFCFVLLINFEYRSSLNFDTHRYDYKRKKRKPCSNLIETVRFDVLPCYPSDWKRLSKHLGRSYERSTEREFRRKRIKRFTSVMLMF